MSRLESKRAAKVLRKNRVRNKITGTSQRPRLSVTISHSNVQVQLIDDSKHKTIAAATTVGTKVTGTMTEKAAGVGKDIAAKAKKAKLKAVVFDRNGRRYAGRLKALAEAVRQEGIEV